MKIETEKTTPFMGSIEDYNLADTVIIGAPMDDTVSFRPGSRFGPSKIRDISIGLEEYSPSLDKELSQYNYYDAGNIVIAPGSTELNLKNIALSMEELFKDSKLPILLGGEHLVTLPAVKEAVKKYPNLALIQFDAHTDLREDYLGSSLSHATVIKKICQIISPKDIYQFGIRSGTKEEFLFASQNTNLFSEVNLKIIEEVSLKLKDRPIYITLDIDVLDPAFAPGTGTPEACGCTSFELLKSLNLLSKLNIIGFDLVEVCPLCDFGDVTSILAAKLVREAILGFGKIKK